MYSKTISHCNFTKHNELNLPFKNKKLNVKTLFFNGYYYPLNLIGKHLELQMTKIKFTNKVTTQSSNKNNPFSQNLL